MENPCEKCIIKVNCTEVCLDKINYGVLLKEGIEAHRRMIQSNNFHNIYYLKKYRKLLEQLCEHRQNEIDIKLHQMEAKQQF